MPPVRAPPEGSPQAGPDERAPMWQSQPMAFDFDGFETLSFDCYGTLIDWEAGIVTAADRLLRDHGLALAGEAILEAHARHEARLEAGPFQCYRDVLVGVAGAICDEQGIRASDEELAAFGASVADWPSFGDSSEALARLATRFRLAVLTNCDDDLFAASNRRLGVSFATVVTAQQVGSYKPALRNFEVLLERLDAPRSRVLHVAQSLFHDHVPAKRLGLTTVWVDRRHGQAGPGATPPARVVPDLTVPDLATLADLAVGPGATA